MAAGQLEGSTLGLLWKPTAQKRDLEVELSDQGDHGGFCKGPVSCKVIPLPPLIAIHHVILFCYTRVRNEDSTCARS